MCSKRWEEINPEKKKGRWSGHEDCVSSVTSSLIGHVLKQLSDQAREHSGSVVECLSRDQGAAGSSLTRVTALWSLSKTHLF